MPVNGGGFAVADVLLSAAVSPKAMQMGFVLQVTADVRHEPLGRSHRTLRSQEDCASAGEVGQGGF